MNSALTSSGRLGPSAGSRRKLRTVRNHPGIYAFDCRTHNTVHYRYQTRANGRQIWKTVHGPLTDARDGRDAARAAASRLTVTSARTLGDLVAAYLEDQRAFVRPKTIDGYQSIWRLVELPLGRVKIDRLNPAMVQQVLLGLLSPATGRPAYSTATVHHVRALLRAVTADAAANRKITDPFGGRALRIPPIVRPARPFLTPAQMLSALEALDGDPLGRLMVVLYGFLGLRRGEGCALRTDHLDPVPEVLPEWMRSQRRPGDLHAVFVESSIEKFHHEERMKLPKTTAGVRFVPVPSIVASTILGAASSSADGWVLPVPSRMRSRLDFVAVAWDRRAVQLLRVGLPRVTLHELRHSYATLLLDAGVHSYVGPRMLGHTLPPMAGLYMHPTWTQLCRAEEQMSNRLAAARDGA